VISAKRFLAKLGNFLYPNTAERELAREVSSHLRLLEDEFVSRGMTADEARVAAKRAYGGVEQSKQLQREERSFLCLEQIRQELRFSAREIGKQPLFTFTAVLSFALGLGVNTAVFALLNALAFRPLPVPNPEQLVRIGSLKNDGMIMRLPGPMLPLLRKEPGLLGICGFGATDAIVEIDHRSTALFTHSLTGDCYQTLGVRPAIGRLLTPADDTPNRPNVAVISYAFWKDKWNRSPSVLGHTIRVGGKPFQIVGVTEERFHGLAWGYPASVSVPISQTTRRDDKDPSRRFYWTNTVARLDPSLNKAKLKSILEAKWHGLLDSALPASFAGAIRDELLRMPPVVTPAATGVDNYFRDHFQPSLTILLMISVLLLLVSCFNVASLLHARGYSRQQEMSIRVAIGAGRLRVVRQLLIETALLVTGGLAVGIGLSLFITHFVVKTFVDAYSRADFVVDVSMDGRVLLFMALATAIVLLIAGVLPAWQTSDVQTTESLKRGSHSLVQGFAHNRRILMGAQMAMTLVVLISANLFTSSLRDLQVRALRFSGDRVLNAIFMPLPGGEVDGSAAVQYWGSLLQRVKNIRGVEAASVASFTPLVTSPDKMDIGPLRRLNRVVVQAPAEFVTPDFMRILRVPLLAGRPLGDADTFDSTPVALVSQTVARRLFPTENPLGQHIRIGTEPKTRDLQIVGVVGDIALEDRHSGEQGFVLLSLWQLPRMGNRGALQVQFSGPATSIEKAVREEIRRGGRQDVFSLRSFQDLRDVGLLQERMLAAVGRAYGVLVLALAAVGLLGLLTFFVSTQKRELAVRMALGANRSKISSLVLREALWVIGIGVFAGLPFGMTALQTVSRMVYGAWPLSVKPILFSVGFLSAVVVAAALRPVWRASSLDPKLILRQQ